MVQNLLSQPDIVLQHLPEAGYLFVEIAVYALYALFPVKTKAHVPLSEEGTNMIFHNMELRRNGHVREGPSEIDQELVNIIF